MRIKTRYVYIQLLSPEGVVLTERIGTRKDIKAFIKQINANKAAYKGCYFNYSIRKLIGI